eukprot:PRCOL_00004406-RA
MELAVPKDQRPINEYRDLKEGFMFSWAQLPVDAYLKRFGLIWCVGAAASFVLLAAPIAAASFDPVEKPSEFFLCGLAGSSLLPSALLLRVYLGWAYVGKRLLSAKVYYEETGWYDGQTFVKPPEVLARDRLMGTYEVKPVLAKLRRSLAVGMATLLVSVSSLVFVPPEELAGARETPVELLKLDDTVADREAAAAYARGRPAYCEDRYDRARAGGICSNYGD